jgi:hypothetical protein
MDLEAQIQLLIHDAPQDGITPKIITAITPVLYAIASSLRHSQYYILQDIEEHWILTTLSNRANPKLEKRVVYAFPTTHDATANITAVPNSQIVAAPLPVIHILFQLIALEPVDSIVFFETSGTTTDSFEVKRSNLQALIQQAIEKDSSHSLIPPDIA